MFLEEYFPQITATLITLFIVLVIRFITTYLTKKFAIRFERLEHRYKLIIKYFDFAYTTIFILIMVAVWGINFRNLGIVFSSVFAVIGVALFAQWSILSNVTAGIIIFFTIPYKIGDRIKIHDKDFYDGPLTIIDIRAFQVILKSDSGEIMAYPNSLILQKGVTLLNQSTVQQQDAGEEKNLSETVD